MEQSHPLFDLDWYLSKNPDVAEAGIDPLQHFLSSGWKEGRDPHPFFSVTWYLNNNPDVAISGVDPLTHYNRLFSNTSAETKYNPEEISNIKVATRLFCSIDEIKEKFDRDFYLESNQDVKDAGVHPLMHYLENGWREGRRPTADFDPLYYLSNNPDVSATGGEPFSHYLGYGKQEGRKPCDKIVSYSGPSNKRKMVSPHPLFDNHYYLEQCPEIVGSGISPLAHYLSVGTFNGKQCRRPESPIRYALRAEHITPVAVPISGVTNVEASEKGVFAHIFYADLADEIVRYCNNVPSPCAIFISTDSDQKADAIFRIFEAASAHPFEVRVFPNRGRDIAPMIVGYADRLQEVEYGVHIHTKKSLHYGKSYDDWRLYLLNGNLGSTDIIRSILSLFEDGAVGAVAPTDFEPIAPLIQWGGNLKNLNALLSFCGRSVSLDTPLEMPTGSMFWFRTKALKPLLDIGLTIDHFDSEEGQVDGTLAHAIERAFFFFVEAAGFKWLRVTSEAKKPLAIIKSPNSILPTVSQFSELKKHIAECTPFLFTRSESVRPRLNLIIPSLDQSKSYAGVSEAVRIYWSIRDILGGDFDGRIISADAPLSGLPDRIASLPVVLSGEDREQTDVVCEGTNRDSSPLSIRRSDIFIASAWWNAASIFEILNWQDNQFNRRQNKAVYLVQDYEPGFYPWSTRFMLAHSTYLNSDRTLPIYNTPLLQDFFVAQGLLHKGICYEPGINPEIRKHVIRNSRKVRSMLIYMRPHAVRNCLEFADAVIATATSMRPDIWNGWSFFSIGEDFDSYAHIKCSHRIQPLGRLTLQRYAEVLSKASLGLSLMVSPHPSYPPLEMADSGVKILTNKFNHKDLSDVHENIRTFEAFDAVEVAKILTDMADSVFDGWQGNAKVDWFFNGRTNLDLVSASAACAIRTWIS